MLLEMNHCAPSKVHAANMIDASALLSPDIKTCIVTLLLFIASSAKLLSSNRCDGLSY